MIDICPDIDSYCSFLYILYMYVVLKTEKAWLENKINGKNIFSFDVYVGNLWRCLNLEKWYDATLVWSMILELDMFNAYKYRQTFANQ